MDPVSLATAALLAHVQVECLAHVDDVQAEVMDLGVGPTALDGGTDFVWDGDPCDTTPVLRLGFTLDGEARRLSVRPRLRAHQSGMHPVTLVVQRGPLRLETRGTLLHDAVIGQTVKVRNDDARTTLTAVLVAPDLVEVP